MAVRNKTFAEIWPSDEAFLNDFYNTTIIAPRWSGDNVEQIFRVTYPAYAMRQIANDDEKIFKSKFFYIMYAYGHEYLKEVEIKKSLTSLSEDEITAGSRQVANVSTNPGTALASDDENLHGVDQQTRMKWTKSKIEGYANLMAVIDTSFIERFVNRFAKLFKKVVVGPEPKEETE